jgi:general secretion pathway protein M
MSAASNYRQLKERLATQWLARTEQERKYLGAGAAVVVLALVYMMFVDPAVTGTAQLRKELPQLRQQAAQLQSLALEAGELARQPVPQVTPMTRESLSASLAARSITAQSLTMTGEYAKLQLNGVSFAGMVNWLDALRRENRIAVQDASITAQSTVGQVDATLTLHQNAGGPGTGAQ